ncbi:MAG: SdpI family protein [Clostridia bacterium]|nr:SdpI family protein [Clostridia bacterium]
MKIKNKKKVFCGAAFCLLPILVGLVLWNKLPDEMPVHWNANGVADGFSSKAFSVFAVPSFFAGLHLLLHFVSGLEKRRKNYARALDAMTFWLLPVFSAICCSIMYLTSMGKTVRVEMVIPALVCVMLIYIGNFLPKCKQNSTMGIKLPWTLKSEENWNKTHRFGGWIWIFCGLSGLVSAFCFKPVFLFVLIIFAVAAPTIYSFVLSRKGI